MASYIVVPARYASTRLPGKPLADIAGKPMIQRVMEAVCEVPCDGVFAAVDDASVEAGVQAAGFNAVMTRQDHESGSDRIVEVAHTLGWRIDDVVVNVQGDEPLVPAQLVADLLQLVHSEPVVEFATVSEPLAETDYADPNAVKVVCSDLGDALYFSRAAIPFHRDLDTMPNNARRHVGIYAYTVGALERFTQLGPSSLEQTERLEQLRWLQAGGRIRVLASAEAVPGGVDTPEDLERMRAHFALSNE